VDDRLILAVEERQVELRRGDGEDRYRAVILKVSVTLQSEGEAKGGEK
jgi:hypothetical protein